MAARHLWAKTRKKFLKNAKRYWARDVILEEEEEEEEEGKMISASLYPVIEQLVTA